MPMSDGPITRLNAALEGRYLDSCMKMTNALQRSETSTVLQGIPRTPDTARRPQDSSCS